MRDPKERLRDVLHAIAQIERYVDRGKEAFKQDELLQTWMVHHLRIIGEAVRGLPDDVRGLAPDVPWSKIIGMRNILVHGYFEIDAEIVWEAAAHDRTKMSEFRASKGPYPFCLRQPVPLQRSSSIGGTSVRPIGSSGRETSSVFEEIIDDARGPPPAARLWLETMRRRLTCSTSLS